MTVPAAAAPVAAHVPAHPPAASDDLAGLCVLCVDNDADILDGMRVLLGRWGVRVLVAATVDDALAMMDRRAQRQVDSHRAGGRDPDPDAAAGDEDGLDACMPDALLVDYHLHDRLDGLATMAELRRRAGRAIPAALVTGDGSDALKAAARHEGCTVLTKPVKPAALRAWLAARR